MFLSLPLSYILFKMGFPSYWAFISIFITNILQQITTWVVIHKYVPFSYWDLLKKTYLPIIVVTGLSVVCPYVICHFMSQGWLRIFILLLSTEILLVVIIYLIAMTSFERDRIKLFVELRVYGKIRNSKR